MTRDEAEKIIREYVPPKPFAYYYNCPYDDGKFCSSGWVYEYPPVSTKLIDAILERDKNCRPYVTDDELQQDEKFNAEMEKRFTDLMNRAKESEYCEKNQHLYSMCTKVNGEYLIIIPMQLMTEVDFKEKASSACETLRLDNYYIYQHISESDKSGHEIFKSFPFRSSCISDADRNAFDNVVRFCDRFKEYANGIDSDTVDKTVNNVKQSIAKLKAIADIEYIKRIADYAKSQGAKQCVK